MAGPGSRLEKVGTIFSRVQGLLRSGALKETEKPIWFDVYAKFPPRSVSLTSQELESQEPQNILYREDLVRAKFYRTYGNVDTIDLREDETKAVSQRFVNKYFEIKAEKSVPKSQIFSAASEALKSEGVRLKTLEEIEKADRKTKESSEYQQTLINSMTITAD